MHTPDIDVTPKHKVRRIRRNTRSVLPCEALDRLSNSGLGDLWVDRNGDRYWIEVCGSGPPDMSRNTAADVHVGLWR